MIRSRDAETKSGREAEAAHKRATEKDNREERAKKEVGKERGRVGEPRVGKGGLAGAGLAGWLSLPSPLSTNGAGANHRGSPQRAERQAGGPFGEVASLCSSPACRHRHPKDSGSGSTAAVQMCWAKQIDGDLQLVCGKSSSIVLLTCCPSSTASECRKREMGRTINKNECQCRRPYQHRREARLSS